MKIKQISFYAFRDDKGATGGPGGVLYLQKKFLGPKYNNLNMRYVFKIKNKIIRKLFRKLFNDSYKGAIAQVLALELFRFHNYYICNDIGSAYALSLLGKKYSLIYHQQGPIVEERVNFGAQLSTRQKKFLQKIEQRAFSKAQSVHFPSHGAQDMFFNSKYCTCKKENVNIGMVLPNTIEVEPQDSTTVNKCLTFFSCGTLTSAKGQDQSIAFIRKFLTSYKKPIKYIVVGDGVLHDSLLSEYNKLKSENPNFDFEYHSKLPHDEIIKIANTCDIYIMLHRISIFDLATLEAMSQSCAIILSDVGGNKDFNIDDNAILVDVKNMDKAIERLLKTDIEYLKQKNKEVFIEHFSPKPFKNYLQTLIKGLNNV